MNPPARPKRGLPSPQRGPVTRERIDGALDALAGIIASRSPEDAATLAPIYDRLERELGPLSREAPTSKPAHAQGWRELALALGLRFNWPHRGSGIRDNAQSGNRGAVRRSGGLFFDASRS